MLTAFAYARVSTKDQAMKDNSIPEQLSRIKHFSIKMNIELIHTYKDSVSAYQEDNRPQFNAMLKDAIKERPKYIIMDDSSRFARTRKESIDAKDLLRKHGINILFANEPMIDHQSVAGLWLEGIQEIKNEATSREIAFHTMKGMTHNLQNRDNETGWCYKNGGKAPYGYIAVSLTRGQDHKGKPMYKTIWELEENNYLVVREIIVDLFTNQHLSYRRIRDELNSRNIESPRGGYWATTTLVEMLKENRLEQYAGTAIWNKEDKRTKGRKYKPRNEWIVVENAHPPIISKEELEAALERKKLNKYNAPDGATRESKYLLTGKNFEGSPLFTCTKCTGNIIGYGNSSYNWKKYICGINRTRGTMACDNNWFIDSNWLEQSILLEIEQRYTAPEKVEVLIGDISSNISKKNKEIDRSIASLKRQLSNCDLEIKRLLDAIKSGIDPSIVLDEVNSLKDKKDKLESDINTLNKSFASDKKNIDIDLLKNFFLNFKSVFDNATIVEKRQLIRTFVRHMELIPETKEIRIEFYPDQIVQSIGAGDRTHIVCTTSGLLITLKEC